MHKASLRPFEICILLRAGASGHRFPRGPMRYYPIIWRSFTTEFGFAMGSTHIPRSLAWIYRAHKFILSPESVHEPLRMPHFSMDR